MPFRARLYIISAIVIGAAVLGGSLVLGQQFPEPLKYLGYLLLACLGSTLKIQLPGIHGSMSVNFLFVLIGVTELTFTETVLLGCAAALVQCLWKPRKRPALIQVLFNIATLATSVAICFSLAFVAVQGDNLPVRLVVAVCAYFVSNTGMVSLVLSLIEKRSFAKIWRQCYLWSFPYYLVGAAIAGVITFTSRTVGWKPSLLMLPLMYMVYMYYRFYLAQQHDQSSSAVAAS